MSPLRAESVSPMASLQLSHLGAGLPGAGEPDVGSLGRTSATVMILTCYSYIINAEQRLNATFCCSLSPLARYVSMTKVRQL